jgi:hypothetical protein
LDLGVPRLFYENRREAADERLDELERMAAHELAHEVPSRSLIPA